MTFMLRNARDTEAEPLPALGGLLPGLTRRCGRIAEALEGRDDPPGVGGNGIVADLQTIRREAAVGGDHTRCLAHDGFDQPGAGRAPHVRNFKIRGEGLRHAGRCVRRRRRGVLRGGGRGGEVLGAAGHQTGIPAATVEIGPTERLRVGGPRGLEQDLEHLAAAEAAERHRSGLRARLRNGRRRAAGRTGRRRRCGRWWGSAGGVGADITGGGRHGRSPRPFT